MNKFILAICILFLSIGQVLAEPVPWPVKPAKSFFKRSGNSVQITTPEEFALMVEYATDSTKQRYHFTLMTDIVINEGDASTWGKNPPKYKWTSIGDSVRPAKLYLDGNGHTISGLYVNSEDDYQGLFGFLDGNVYNLNIVNSFIKGRDFVGAAAGATSSSVSEIFVDAIIEGRDYVGGVVGYPGYTSDASSANRCVFKGSVKGRGYVGGIIGYGTVFYKNSGGVSNCDNYGSVYGVAAVGGIVGDFYVDVPKSDIYFTMLRNYGTVSGNKYVGGVAGSFIVQRDGGSTVKYDIGLLRNMGEIIGGNYVGGLMGEYGGGQGHNLFVLEESYNAGKVSGEDRYTAPLYNFSPYSSDRKDTVIRCYNFAEIYSQGTLLEEKTRMRDIDKYADSLGPNYLPDTGNVKINGGYPILLSESRDFKHLEGSGTEKDPFLITSSADLLLFNKHSMANRYKDKNYYKQTADVEWNAQENWAPVSVQEIHYDGGGHKISKLRSYLEGDCAAFLDASSQIAYVDNLVLEDVDIRGGSMAAGVMCSGPLYASNIKISGSIAAMGRSGKAGGIIAFMWYGSITNVVNEADVSADALPSGMAGGIMGRTRYDGDNPIICNVVNRGNIRATLNAGGITGRRGVITYAENYGSVFADGHVGGISGFAKAISNSFNRGEVKGEGVVGGVAGAVELAYGVYNAGRIVADYPEVVGAVFGEIETYYGKLDSGKVAIQYAYHQKDGFPFAGKITSEKGLRDTASYTHEELIDKETVKGMGGIFKADENDVNDGYPVIAYEFDGEGTAEKPFLVKGKDDLVKLSQLSVDTNRYAFYTDKNYRLTQDVVFDSSETWRPISGWRIDSFKGVFDGGGHVISNLVVDLDPSGFISDSKAALIANASGATVRNLGIKNADIKGAYAAAIVADAVDVKIINCWNDRSNIYGKLLAGGLVGYASSSILLDRSFNTGTIDGEDDVAGLIGNVSIEERSYILNSYHRGKLAGKNSSSRYVYYSYFRASPLLVRQNLYTTDSLGYYQCAGCSDNMYHLKRSEKDSTGLSAKEMKSREFAERLGEAFAYDSLGVNDGFPILSGKELPLPILPEDTATAVKPEMQKGDMLNFAIVVLNRNIVLQGELPGRNVAIFDVRGSKVWAGRTQAKTLSIPIANPGIYIVRCGKRTSKIVVR